MGGFHPDIFPSDLQHLQGPAETGLTQEAKVRGFKAIYHPEALIYHHVLEGRMTYAYFEKRSFFHGIGCSYIAIRAAETGPKLDRVIRRIKTRLRPIKTRLRFLRYINYSAHRIALCRRLWRAEQQGYQFHQDAVRQHPEILDWICKSDYWDCHDMSQRLTYPDIYKV